MSNFWQEMCVSDGLDPVKRMQSREMILNHANALECTVYRSDENDPDLEELDLGDARIVFTGAFIPPIEWNDEACAAFFEDNDPDLFCTALIECEAPVASKNFFTPDVGDYVAVVDKKGSVTMYFLYDWNEDDSGRSCVLIKDDSEIEF